MEYELAIGEIILNFMQSPGQLNFGSWLFYTFFHPDTCPSGAEPDPMYNCNDEKLDVLLDFYDYPFILPYAIPVGYTLGASDIKKLGEELKDLKGDGLTEMMRNRSNPLFPYYEIDGKKLRAHLKKNKKRKPVR